MAESIVNTISKSFGERKILEVNVKIGELRGLNFEVLKDALKILSKESNLENVKFNLLICKATFKCLNCGEEWNMRKALKILKEILQEDYYVEEEDELEPPTHFIPGLIVGLQRCPRCGRMDIDVRSGRELEISGVVVE